jgi:hypothetical protein
MKALLRLLWLVVAAAPLMVGCSSNNGVEEPKGPADPPPEIPVEMGENEGVTPGEL